MASYDVTDSAMQGYKLVWDERSYLFKLAIFPLFIKFVCAMTVIINGFEFDFAKQALLMLPSYFADGWVMSHLVRLIFLDQRWPFRPSGQPQRDMEMLRDRAGGIMAGTVCFALLEFIKTGLTGLMMVVAVSQGNVPGQPPVTPSPADAPSVPTMMIAICMIIVTIWLIRYLWVYIPIAAGVPARAYLKRVGGMMGSIRLLGVWMICSIPLLFAFMLLANMLLAGIPQGEAASPVIDFVMNSLRVIVIMLTTLVTTAGIAFVIRGMFEEKRA